MTVVTIHQRTLHFGITIARFLSKMVGTTEARVIKSQLMRAGGSIGANVVEAQHSVSKKEFQRYLSIALRSARETEYRLNILKELAGDNQATINDILQENDEISRIIASIILKSKE